MISLRMTTIFLYQFRWCYGLVFVIFCMNFLFTKAITLPLFEGVCYGKSRAFFSMYGMYSHRHLKPVEMKQRCSLKIIGIIHGRRNRGHWGHVPPIDFAINKEVPLSFLENAPTFLRKKVPSKCCPPLQV